jgi:hypothetical protein
MPDGNITKISEPVEGIPTLTESGRIRLIPIQQELETIPGKNVMFNICRCCGKFPRMGRIKRILP